MQPTRGPDLECGWEGPVFVIGMPRSGTKLLRSILTRHSRIRIPPVETEFLPFLVQWVTRHGPPRSESEFRRLHAALSNATYFYFRDRARPELSWAQWREACGGRFEAGGLFEGFIRSELGVVRGSGIIWGDKSPAYMRCVDLLAREFPNARIVHIVRDVRDYCVSIRKAWSKDVRRAAVRWGEDVRAVHDYCASHPLACIEVKYEKLLSTPQQELRALSDFLGIAFEPQMLQLEQAVENLGDAKGRPEIVADNFTKYRRSLSRREIAAIESLSWDAMSALGYAPEVATGPGHLSRASLAARKLKDGVALLLRDVDNFGFYRTLRFHANHQKVSR